MLRVADGLYGKCTVTRNTPSPSLFSQNLYSNPLFPEQIQRSKIKSTTKCTPRSYSTKKFNCKISLPQPNNFLSPLLSRSFCSNVSTIHEDEKYQITEKISLESAQKIISVFEKIEELTGGKFKLKDDFFSYSKLNLNLFPFSGREESINQVLSNIEERNSDKWINWVTERRFQFPIISVHGSPGSGKTRFIDEIAPRIMNHYKNKFVVISVSFTGRTQFQFSTNSETNLAIRVLFEAFIKPDEFHSFEEFCSFFDSDILLFKVFDAFCYFMKIKNNIEDFQIMLCIDEVIKSGNLEYTLIAAHRTMADFRKKSDPIGMTRVFLLVSTTDSLKDFYNKWRRIIRWITLPPLTEEESLKMMGPEITKIVIKNELMQYLVRDSGGHPRTIQAVADAITNDKLKMVFDYNTAVRIVTKELIDYGSQLKRNILSLSNVLLGNIVSPSDIVPGSKETYDQLLLVNFTTLSTFGTEIGSFLKFQYCNFTIGP